ncbi:MAG TPA: 50S ribosomal protein L17 [Bacilli bacterium]|nr:50S ribosomal protein L17 [Bacilli bacterium]
MATQGRKNVHGKGGVRFKAPYTSAKHKSQLRNLVSTLIVQEKVTVTSGMAADLIKLSDRLVTYAKKGDLHSRRLAASIVRNYIADEKQGLLALDKLFGEIGPRYKDRSGGYTKALRLENRRGDNAPIYLVAFVQ